MIKQIILALSLCALLYGIPYATLSWASRDYAYYDDSPYYGSGRDHAYSAYIDRAHYIGTADYALVPTDDLNVPITLRAIPILAPIAVQTPKTSTPSGNFVVNIPNERGGYNTVIIKKSADGFIGPQGECYPEFPKVFQLQMKYGK